MVTLKVSLFPIQKFSNPDLDTIELGTAEAYFNVRVNPVAETTPTALTPFTTIEPPI